MNERLVGCFKTVFPALNDEAIRCAAQATIPAWDSVATIKLISVVEDEFGVELDLDRLAELDSFERVLQFLHQQKAG